MSAQNLGWKNPNFKQDSLLVADTVKLTYKGILQEKFKILDSLGNPIPSELYTINFERNEIYFQPSLAKQMVKINYFINPKLVESVYYAKNPSIIIGEEKPVDIYHQIEPNSKQENRDVFEGLNSKGTMVRGIRFGNNQSASVQSSLDLELSGKLSDDITVNAAIADNNVPIESDGYTQNLQEFDKVYIELATKSSKIRAGQIDINTDQNHDFFNPFSQKVTGIQLSTTLKKENSTTNIFVTGSITRGEFMKMSFTGQDGNQGPYRLSGKNSETYIIVISGSEKVYIDGIQVDRGEQNDYIINYNTGEITFTSNRLITSNTRIYVEYLYNSRNYSQTLLYGGAEYQSKNLKLSGYFYSLADSKNNSLGNDLSNAEKEILANAGNDTSKMYTVAAELTTYDSNKILYKKETVNNTDIFVYTTDSNGDLYQVTFTYVGANQGNYNQVNTNENGKIYQYSEPVAGVSQGDYEPLKQLVAPTKLNIYTLNGEYQLKNKGNIGFNIGLSNYDQNLFSSIDDNNNAGIATRVYGEKDFKYKDWKISPFVEWNYISKNYKSSTRLRAVEFARDFNLEQELSDANQNYITAKLTTKWKEKFTSQYKLDYLENEGTYKGIRNQVEAKYISKKDELTGRINILSTNGTLENTAFTRYLIDEKRSLNKKFWIGARVWGESNEIDTKDVMSITTKSSSSFSWNEYQLKGGFADSLGHKIDLTIYQRKDDSVRLGNWQNIQRSKGIIFNSVLIQKQDHQLTTNFHFRKVNYNYLENSTEDYLTGNIKWYKTFFNQGFKINVDYEIGSGVEPQREFQYVKVSDGMGIYKWTDYNGDGIEQMDEFEVAEFIDQANYIRVYTNTVEYISTNKNQFNFTLNFRPSQVFNPESKFLSRWLFTQNISATNSLRKNGEFLEWNPFTKSSKILSKTRTLRSSIFFNQGTQYKWSTNFIYNQQQSQTYIYTGSEYRDSDSYLLQTRYRIMQNFIASFDSEYMEINSNSDLYLSRRYTLHNIRFSPKLTYQTEKSLIASLYYNFQNKKNIVGTEKLNQSDLGTEIQWNSSDKMTFSGSFSYIHNSFIGNQESIVGNQMMEGLRSGNNFVWQLQLQRQLTRFLQLNISYDGRKTEVSKTIHVGSVQVQARF
ncbi:hypothetical protein [Chishuiella sp.]|uniref:hypothetical protein n=1 Tax=Chishuiella sp. TaxID=1969467 RepID=UPI0028AE8931|nr:hypothetical protein [Chishuiella sp.]